MLRQVIIRAEKGDNITIGLVGGSASLHGEMGIKFFKWFQAMYPKGSHKFIKRAMGATGSYYPAMCLLSQFGHTVPDILLFEYALNDCCAPHSENEMDALTRKHQASTEQLFTPDYNLERIARTLFSIGSSIIVLNLFGGDSPIVTKRFVTNEMFYDRVINYYDVPQVSFIKELQFLGLPVGRDMSHPFWSSVYFSKDKWHPDSNACFAISNLLIRTVSHIAIDSHVGSLQLPPLFFPANTMGSFNCSTCWGYIRETLCADVKSNSDREECDKGTLGSQVKNGCLGRFDDINAIHVVGNWTFEEEAAGNAHRGNKWVYRSFTQGSKICFNDIVLKTKWVLAISFLRSYVDMGSAYVWVEDALTASILSNKFELEAYHNQSTSINVMEYIKQNAQNLLTYPRYTKICIQVKSPNGKKFSLTGIMHGATS